MIAAGERLYVATIGGRLICMEAEKPRTAMKDRVQKETGHEGQE